jgi:hypothetical protein
MYYQYFNFVEVLQLARLRMRDSTVWAYRYWVKEGSRRGNTEFEALAEVSTRR